jgi:molybdate transport system substrate-binding protein
MLAKQMGTILFLALLAGCTGSAPEAITLSAAASTREAVEQIAADFRQQTGVAVSVNLGPSSELARQIERGGTADLFLSANEAWADYLAERGLVAQRRDLLTNRLVIVVPADSSLAIPGLAALAQPAVRRLALAAPVVPAGRYAREALRQSGIWEQVKDRVLEGGDVRAALIYVVRKEAEAGLVYATDVQATSQVRVALEVQSDLHTPIRYPLVLVRREPIKAGARRFYEYLSSAPAAERFRTAGFGLVP